MHVRLDKMLYSCPCLQQVRQCHCLGRCQEEQTACEEITMKMGINVFVIQSQPKGGRQVCAGECWVGHRGGYLLIVTTSA